MINDVDTTITRRSDLYPSRSQSPISDDTETLNKTFQAQLEAIYGIPTYTTVDPSVASPQNHVETSIPEPEDELSGYAFRLFATPPATPDGTKTTGVAEDALTDIAQRDIPRVILTDDEPLGPGAFVTPNRSRSYFFSAPLSPSERLQYEVCAITAADVYAEAQKTYPALRMPWKVSVVRVKKSKSDVLVEPHHVQCPLTPPRAVDESTSVKRRTKRNKAARIKLRVRCREEEAAKLKKELELSKKAESEKEKRVRRNREKKLKKREKEKAEKVAARLAGVETDQAASKALECTVVP